MFFFIFFIFSKDIGTIFRIYFSSILHISAPALCYPVKTNKRKSQQSKWSCFKSNTTVVIDVHPNGYTNATNRAVSLDLHHWCQTGTRILLWQSLWRHLWWGPEDQREFQEVQHLGKCARPDGCQLCPQPRGSLQTCPGTASPVFNVLVEGHFKEAIRDKAYKMRKSGKLQVKQVWAKLSLPWYVVI